MKRALGLLACLGALTVPAPALAACAGENDNVTAGNLTQAAGAMACLVNDYRESKGLNALSDDAILDAAGLAHSNDMVARHYFSHFASPPAGADPQARAVLLGFPSNTAIGENIAFRTGSATPAQMVADFKGSPDHNANMLDPEWRGAGYGFALGSVGPTTGTGLAVTQEFGGTSGGGGGGGGGGTTSCPKAEKLAAKLARLLQKGASKSKISKTKKKLKKARAACR